MSHAKSFLCFSSLPAYVFLCLSKILHAHIQKGSKDPIPEEEFDFQGLEDEDECGTDGENKDGSFGDKAERGKRESWCLCMYVVFYLFIYFFVYFFILYMCVCMYK